jgi:hypothetical protein
VAGVSPARALGALTIDDLTIELDPARAQIVKRRLVGLVIVTTRVAASVSASLVRALLVVICVPVAAMHPAHHEEHRDGAGE